MGGGGGQNVEREQGAMMRSLQQDEGVLEGQLDVTGAEGSCDPISRKC